MFASRRLFDPDEDGGEGQKCRNHGQPEHEFEVVVGCAHQSDSDQRASEGADGVEALTQTECRATKFWRSHVGNQCIARGTANTLADAVGDASEEDGTETVSDGKQRFGQRTKPVADGG